MNPDTTKDQAWDEGYDAHDDGLLPFNNPYDLTDERHQAWLEGWETAFEIETEDDLTYETDLFDVIGDEETP